MCAFYGISTHLKCYKSEFFFLYIYIFYAVTKCNRFLLGSMNEFALSGIQGWLALLQQKLDSLA